MFLCSVTCLVILELQKYSNNLSITVSAAPTEVQGILQEEFLFMDSLWTTIHIAKNRRIKTSKQFQIGVWLCLFRSDFVADCFQVAYRPLLFGSSSWKKVRKNDGVSMIWLHKKAIPNGTLVKADRSEKIKERRRKYIRVNNTIPQIVHFFDAITTFRMK